MRPIITAFRSLFRARKRAHSVVLAELALPAYLLPLSDQRRAELDQCGARWG